MTAPPSSVLELARALIRSDTTNPPGNEGLCASVLERFFTDAGFDVRLVGRHDDRPNLVTRLPGSGEAPPLLFYGHMDVVTTEHQTWRHPPFAAEVVDGYLWGRGALDMKGGLAMLAGSLVEARRRGLVPAGDVVFCAFADEERGGTEGAAYVVEHHADLLHGVRFAVGEFGGFTLHFGGRRFYPVMVGEKQICHIRVVATGRAGHASQPRCDGAVTRLARFLTALDENPPPCRVTPAVRTFIEGLAVAEPALFGLLDPTQAPATLAAMGPWAILVEPLMRATVSPTMLAASSQLNVIPARATADLDCRLLPSHQPEELVNHLRSLAPAGVDVELVGYEPGPGEPDLELFPVLAAILRDADVGALPIPFILAGATDGRILARLGITTYGFTPLRLPADFDFFELAHAPDERVPIEALDFGVEALLELIGRYGR